MIYGYVRVSTSKQTVENQKFEITDYLAHNNFNDEIKFIEETKSGTISYKNRALGKLIKRLKKRDILICSEISRLGRSMLMIMEILNQLLNKEITLITIKENMKFDNSISSKVISFAFSLSAEIERNLISQRTKEALELRKQQGIKLGRPVGSRNKKYKLDKYYSTIVFELSQGTNIYKIAKKCGKCYINTLKNYIKKKSITPTNIMQ